MRILLALVGMVVITNGVVAGPLADQLTPMPKFSPQPSATLIYCKEVVGVSMRGLNGDVKSLPKVQSGIDQGNSRMMVKFSADQIQVSSAADTPKGNHIFSPSFPYKILNDDPENFFAIQDRSKLMGLVQTIAMNRIAGTLIWTSGEASLPETDHPGMQGHPYTSSSFYVCGPTDD